MNKLRTTKILKHFAFTLAEVLITLGIIGIVAALTIPNLIASYQKKQTVVKLKKVYAVLNQIARNSSDENGDAASFLTSHTDINENIIKEFFEKYWFSHLNAPTIIDNRKNYIMYKYLNGEPHGYSVYTGYDAGKAFFSTMDGVSYFVMIMKNVKDENNQYKLIYHATEDVYVDLNGTKPPNTIGRDVFAFQINLEDNNASPMGSNTSNTDINNSCKGKGLYCAEKIKRDGWTIKHDYPWK